MESIKSFESKEEIVLYTALFVDDISALKEKYPPVHPNEHYHHSTITFKPKSGKDGLELGKKYSIKVIGRVISDKVDALLVENQKSTNENPHITLSTAKGIKPFASNVEIAKAIEDQSVISEDGSIEITEGYFNGKNEIIA